MIRLTLILCFGLFGAMKVIGEDRGQLRFGLMPSNEPASVAVAMPSDLVVAKSEPLPAAANTAVINASFAPEAPLMTAPADTVTAAAPAAVAPLGRILTINTKSVNVRQGPGTDYAVVDRLTLGEPVLVVSQTEGPDGWSQIRIEGDGVEGFVASRLLSE